MNHAFSVQHACGLSTTPTLLACADATVHAQFGKGYQIIKQLCMQYSGYRAHGVFALRSSNLVL